MRRSGRENRDGDLWRKERSGQKGREMSWVGKKASERLGRKGPKWRETTQGLSASPKLWARHSNVRLKCQQLLSLRIWHWVRNPQELVGKWLRTTMQEASRQYSSQALGPVGDFLPESGKRRQSRPLQCYPQRHQTLNHPVPAPFQSQPIALKPHGEKQERLLPGTSKIDCHRQEGCCQPRWYSSL